jgi:hypothetical protein
VNHPQINPIDVGASAHARPWTCAWAELVQCHDLLQRPLHLSSWCMAPCRAGAPSTRRRPFPIPRLAGPQRPCTTYRRIPDSSCPKRSRRVNVSMQPSQRKRCAAAAAAEGSGGRNRQTAKVRIHPSNICYQYQTSAAVKMPPRSISALPTATNRTSKSTNWARGRDCPLAPNPSLHFPTLA